MIIKAAFALVSVVLIIVLSAIKLKNLTSILLGDLQGGKVMLQYTVQITNKFTKLSIGMLSVTARNKKEAYAQCRKVLKMQGVDISCISLRCMETKVMQ